MAKTDLKLYSKAQGTEKKITTSLPYINPSADSTTLKQFAVKLNNFTTNVYDETDRVQTINIDTEEVPVGYDDLPTTEFTITQVETFNASELVGGHAVHFATVTPADRGTINALKFRVITTGMTPAPKLGVYSEKSTGQLYILSTSDFTLSNGTIFVYVVYANMKSSGTPPLYAKLQQFEFEIPVTTS